MTDFVRPQDLLESSVNSVYLTLRTRSRPRHDPTLGHLNPTYVGLLCGRPHRLNHEHSGKEVRVRRSNTRCCLRKEDNLLSSSFPFLLKRTLNLWSSRSSYPLVRLRTPGYGPGSRACCNNLCGTRSFFG